MFLLVAESMDAENPVYLVYEHYTQAAQLSLEMQKVSEGIEFDGTISIYRMISMDWKSLFGDDEDIKSYGDTCIEWKGKFYQLMKMESWQTFK